MKLPAAAAAGEEREEASILRVGVCWWSLKMLALAAGNIDSRNFWQGEPKRSKILWEDLRWFRL